ncbi:MAG: methylated-DNA--[protein]-cysteine S-methyltransferase [Verrucomicrobia bacterium]|nr:MAG: methylated-DNA--[protein]-cysteine S-methyltransferase [Verrucomicrobiota bacterium]
MKLYHLDHTSPVGILRLVASENGLCAVLWNCELSEHPRLPETTENTHHPTLQQAAKELDEYFAKQRKKFTIPLDPIGTPFQLKVWQALRTIPYGETRSYGEQARMIGAPNAARAVGAANGKNPISIIVPCHRVIGKNGSLTGFGGGLHTKQKLLQLEGILWV